MKKNDLTSGTELFVISNLALPLIGSALLQFLYNFIDLFFVGGLGSNALATVGSASFFMNVGYAFQAMIVAGGGIKIAHAIGGNKEKELSSYIGNSILLNLLLGVFTEVVFLLYGHNLLGFLGLNNKEVEISSYWYLAVSGVMLFFSYFNTFFIRMFSSFGNNKQSFYISAVGIILNIVLDPIFIYWFKWGVIGAAIATLFAQIIMFVSFVYLARDVLLNRDNKQLSLNKSLDIVKLGLPMSVQRVLFTIISILLAKLIVSYGTNAIAAQKIGFQIESVTFVVMGSLSGAVSSFIGQNFGAAKHTRILAGYRVSMMLGILYALVTSILFFFWPEQLARLFTLDRETIGIASSYLKIVGISQIFMAMEMISTGVYIGIGLPNISSTISIVFTALRIPLAMYLIPIAGLNGVWWSITISSILKGVLSVIIFQIVYKRRMQHEF